MRVPREHIAIRQVADRLAEIFEIPGHAVSRCFEAPYVNGQNWDAVFSVAPHSFAVEWKRSGSLNQVALEIHQMGEARDGFPDGVIPLLAVPYMGEPARERCAQAGLPWLDRVVPACQRPGAGGASSAHAALSHCDANAAPYS